MVSERIRRIAPSPTLSISQKAGEMRAAGIDVLDFSAGQPDFPTPDPVKRAGVAAIDGDQTRYTANPGLPELRGEIASYVRGNLGVEYAAQQILVSPGAKASLYFACMALVDPGDEVLLPSPYWVSYPEQIRLAGGEPVAVPCAEEDGFRVDVAALEAARTDRTRLLVLNYPSNPTGASYDREQLERLAAFCVDHGIRVLADEIYSRLLYDGRHFTSIASLGPEIRDLTVMINGMSKAYSMTGWRVGWAAGPQDVIAGMSRLQSHSTSNATSISQWASIEALRLPDAELHSRVEEFQLRRDEMVTLLRQIPGVTCQVPDGAFYVFPNVAARLGASSAVNDPDGLARYLLDEARVAIVPGEGFGSSEHVRLSYACSLDRVREGV
jgi:aspartate aminotransferase